MAIGVLVMLDTPAIDLPADVGSEPLRRAGRPRREESSQLSDRVLACAFRSFCNNGFALTTIEGIAADCGTTRRSIIHRFPDKDALLAAVAERHIHGAMDELHSMLRYDDPDPMSALRDACRFLLSVAMKPATAAFYRMAINETQRIETLASMMVWSSDEYERAFVRLILAAQNAGTFQRHSAPTLATAVIGTFMSNPLNRLLMGDPLMRDELHIDIYFSEAWSVFLAAA